ncbi:S-adenosyl-L-methionine-dependent methyltransferase, partial [Clavulina sp. PMI_390]
MSSKEDNWSAQNYNTNASFVYSAAFTAPVLGLLNPQPGERILDLGCGTGELDDQLAKAVGSEGFVLATDASADMLAKAKAEFGSILNVEFAQVDSAHLSRDAVMTGSRQVDSFDGVFSNAALHWILAQAPDKVSVFRAVHSLLAPNGRFAAELGGALNIVGIRSSIHRALRKRGYDPVKLDPWYFPGVEEGTAMLEQAGFTVKEIALVPRITPLPGTLVPWLRTFFVGSFKQAVEAAHGSD